MSSKEAKRTSLIITIISSVVCLAVGVLVGYFILSKPFSAQASFDSLSVSKADLDKPVAHVNYNGKVLDISVRDLILQSSSVDSAKKEDGSYNVPGVDATISVARSKVMLEEAKKQGIKVSDKDVEELLQKQFGTNDIESIATSYQLTKEEAEDLIKETATISKLRDKSIKTKAPEDVPLEPAEPEEGKEEIETAEYAQYIINLAGDEWDNEKGTWSDVSGPYAAALAKYTIKPDSASYEAASAAYQVAYQKYNLAIQNYSKEWQDYCNEIFGKATLSLDSLTLGAVQ